MRGPFSLPLLLSSLLYVLLSDKLSNSGDNHLLVRDLARFSPLPPAPSTSFSSSLLPSPAPLFFLTLYVLDYQSSEDDGLWTCVGGLTDRNDNVLESSTPIIVMRSEISWSIGVLVCVITAASILMFATLGIIGYIVIRMRRHTLTSAPPAYTQQDYYAPPKSLPVIKEYQY